jgi:tetratricopeptide (TPR) repeat protein
MPHAVFMIATFLICGSHSASDGRRLHDTGPFNAAAAAVQSRPEGRQQYLAAQNQEKTDAAGARAVYERLAAGSDPAWGAIGRSALALAEKRLDEALSSANQAVERAPSLPEAHYQRGMALTARRDYPTAAAAFDRATTLDPSFASAHYYGGLAEYRANRIDRMAAHFEAFLKLAPNAPERAEVESIMRTVRGR